MTVKHDPPLVLVADDQIPTTIMLERVFEYEGYQVKSVYDGIAALDTAQKLLPDLILLDINMPGMNGLEVLRKLRENIATVGIPTIIITAMGEPADIAQGLTLGADDYLPKPFHPRELLARAQSKMKARKLEETLQRRSQELEALLRASEELSQRLEVGELLDLVLYLALDLLPGDLAAIYRLDNQQSILSYRIQSKPTSSTATQYELPSEDIIRKYVQENRTISWPDGSPLFPSFMSGMATTLKQGNDVHGVLVLTAQQPFDHNHLRLFEGIGRQAGLALRNAELYEIQANYALHLEDMVAARTAELQSAQQLLFQAEKLASVGRLAASIAHEINNPLFPIRINLERMLEDVKNRYPIDAEEIERTLESVERISRIVNQLLQFTGKRNPNSQSDLQILNINNIIEDVISLNRKYFQQESMSIEADLNPLPPVHGSKDQLEQVFMNLTLNARAAMQKGGKMLVTTRLEKDTIVIQFIDTGYGIPADLIDTIFEPFVSTKENGTGLGLFISYGIIQNHRGSIEVKSKVNSGSTFTIRLPITGETA
jgi:two-component system, NtrC family, sensor kinase